MKTPSSYLSILLDACGALFIAKNRRVGALVLMATFCDPATGMSGLLAGIAAITARAVLRLPGTPGNADILNAIYAGLALAAFYGDEPRILALAAFGGALSIPLGTALRQVISNPSRALPLLGAPFLATTWILFATARGLALPMRNVWPVWPHWLPIMPASILSHIGALFYVANPMSGLLILAALLIASRALALLALSGGLLAQLLVLAFSTEPVSGLVLSAAFNGALTAIFIGGVLSIPAFRALVVTLGAVVLSTALSVGMLSLATNLGMPSLSAPFVLTVWLIHAALRPDVSAWWSRFWLSVPSCPEDSLVAGRLAASRGLAPGSIGLVPPFDGIMTVAQGMDGDLTHCGPWRYALDFIKTENSYSYRNTGYALNDYMAFAHSVLSPAKGIIAACRNDIADNAPGTLNLIENWGNHILIDIGDNLFVLLAHLQQGSLQVECGTAVSVGTPLARFGNSGRSSQPHLHLHVQRGSQLGAPTVPMHLGSCILDGNHYALDAHPVSGQTISVATPRKTLLNACAPSHGRVWNFTTAGSSWQLEAKIGLFGTIHLNSGCGGSIEAFVGADMLALYHRTGSADPALDAFALAFGLTPYAADARKWTDAPDAALLPLSFGQRLGVTLRHPFGANLDSHYERHWDAGRGLWCQSGHHSLTRIFGVINTESTAWLSESLGIVAFSLAIDGHILIDAHLARCGNVGDHGIPAWQVSCLHIATS